MKNSSSRTFDTDKNGFIDFKEFLLAVDVTSGTSPEKKLSWAFRSVVEAIKTLNIFETLFSIKLRLGCLLLNFPLECTMWTAMDGLT